MKANHFEKFPNFIDFLQKEINEYVNRPFQTYQILFPFHGIGDGFKNQKHLSILGSTFQIENWEKLQRDLEFPQFINQAKGFLGRDCRILQEVFTPLIITIDGRDEEEAFERAFRSYDIIRTSINLVSVIFLVRHQWGGFPKPYSSFMPPPVFGIFSYEGNYLNLFYNETKYQEYNKTIITPEQMIDLVHFISKLHEPQNHSDSMHMFIEAILMYGRAIDNFDWRLSFIFLRQVFEELTLKSIDKLTERDVITRVSTILNLGTIDTDMLEVMYNSRNNLVHESVFPESNSFAMDEFSYLKSFVDRLVNISYKNIEIYPTIPQLSEFYWALCPKKKK
jgi:hypothetical protein